VSGAWRDAGLSPDSGLINNGRASAAAIQRARARVPVIYNPFSAARMFRQKC